MPIASASARWLAGCPLFSEISTSHIGSDPRASARASSKALLTILDTRVRHKPNGSRTGRDMSEA